MKRKTRRKEKNRNSKGHKYTFFIKRFSWKRYNRLKVRKNIISEQIEQQVLLKVDVTEEEYNKIK